MLAIPEFAPNDAHRLVALREQHCPPDQHGLAPHVTLMYALPEDTSNVVCRTTSECAKRHQAFDLMLTEVVSEHAPPDSMHYLLAQPGPGGSELLDLHEDLYRTLPEARSWLFKPFNPHVTLGIFEKQVQCKRVLEELRRDQWEVRGRVHSLTVIRWTGVLLDEIVAEYELLA